MDKIIYFDYCALIIIIVLFISVFSRKMTHGKVNKAFIATLLTTLLTIILDIIAISLDNSNGEYITAKYVFHGLYLLIHNMSVPVYILYLIALTDTWHKIRTNIYIKYLLPLPIVVVAILLVINVFNLKTFYLDANLHYTRGPWFPLVYISALIYVVFGAYYVWQYKKTFRRSRFWALMSIFLAIAFATVMQMLFPRYPIEMFATSLGLLFIAMMIQRPEENIDVITDLHNIHAYSTDIKRGLTNQKQITIILINLSNYASLRDIAGYDAGHDLLRSVAKRLAELNKASKAHADLYYLDKGRFRVVIDHLHHDKVDSLANAINHSLESGIVVKNLNLNLMPYVCVAEFTGIIENYDALMYFGERLSLDYDYTGEVLYANEIFKKERFDLMNKLDDIIENALINRKFQVYYQPIFSVKENRFNSAEALLRLIDDKFGFISPELFIPAAEQSGAIHRIGTYVLEEVCDFIASDDFKKLNLDYIEVNLSVAQCMHKDLPSQVMNVLRKYKLSPDKINLEITETIASCAQNTMAENLDILTKEGVSFSLDDYGTGYSNIQRVASLPLKIVKLDRTFVNCENNPRMSIVLENTIHMLKDMEMEIVAEGIETEQLMKRFADMNCEYIQGYYYSKPIPRDEFVKYILENQPA